MSLNFAITRNMEILLSTRIQREIFADTFDTGRDCDTFLLYIIYADACERPTEFTVVELGTFQGEVCLFFSPLSVLHSQIWYLRVIKKDEYVQNNIDYQQKKLKFANSCVCAHKRVSF